MYSRLNLFDTSDSDTTPASNAYTLLLLLTAFAVAICALAKFAESKNRLNYESRSARIIAGLLLLMTHMLHTKDGDLEIRNERKKLIVAGPHRTGLVESLVIASKMKGAPPQFLATDGFNAVPGVAAFMKMFKAIPVKINRIKGENGRTANAGSLELASEVLNENGCVTIFPQGNFSIIGQEPPIVYSGAAKLAVKNEVPIHVIRLDGFWCLQNPLIPLFIRNDVFYRALFSMFHMNNVRTTLCSVIDFHLNPENKDLTDEQKIEGICAELYAYYRHTEELNSEQIHSIKKEISDKTHLLIWKNKVKQDKLGKELTQLKNEEAELEKSMLTLMKSA